MIMPRYNLKHSDVIVAINGLSLFTTTVSSFIEQVSQSEIVAVPEMLYHLDRDQKIVLVPDCIGIQTLLNLSIQNMDD